MTLYYYGSIGGNDTGGADQIYDNYDSVFKDAMLLFKDKALDFYGLDGALQITEPLKTEAKEIVVTTEFSDLNFMLNNGIGLHTEEETSVSFDDLMRFCGYNVHLARSYKTEFITVILTNIAPSVSSINHSCLMFHPIIVNLGTRDADSTIQRLRRQISDKTPINELEIVYLSLYHSTNLQPVEILKQCAELISQVDASDDHKRKLAALTLVASNKVVAKEDLERIWEDVKNMTKLKILEVAEEQGEIRGRQVGRQEGRQEGRLEGIGISAEIICALHKKVPVETIAEQYRLPVEDVAKIQSALPNVG